MRTEWKGFTFGHNESGKELYGVIGERHIACASRMIRIILHAHRDSHGAGEIIISFNCSDTDFPALLQSLERYKIRYDASVLSITSPWSPPKLTGPMDVVLLCPQSPDQLNAACLNKCENMIDVLAAVLTSSIK